MDESRASPPVAHQEQARKHLSSDNKIFTIENQYNHQNNKIYAQMSLGVKENVLSVQEGHHLSYVML